MTALQGYDAAALQKSAADQTAKPLNTTLHNQVRDNQISPLNQPPKY